MRLIGACAAVLGGLAVGDTNRLEPQKLLLGGLLALLGAGLAWQRPAWRMLGLVACAASLGGLRATLAPADDAGQLEPFAGLTVRLRGVVVQPPSPGPASVQLLVDAASVAAAGREPVAAAGRDRPPPGDPSSTGGRVRVVGDPAQLAALGAGESVELEGRLLLSEGDARRPPTLLFPRLLSRAPPAAFEPSAWLAGVRAAAQSGIYANLPEPQASLSAGVLLGGAGRLDADFRLQLQRSGLAHVVAIDGFKQVMVAAVLGAVATPVFGSRLAALAVLLGIAGYTLLTGAHPSAVRAALMVGLATLGALSGRLADPLTSLLVAATSMALVDPRILLDLGLQLSLSALLGIVLLWPRLRPRLRRVPRVVAEPVGLTAAVTLATLPVTLSTFQLVSLVSPAAHVLAVPLLPPVLVSAALLALLAPIQPVATIVGWVAWLPSTLLVDIIEISGSLPGAALSTGRLPPGAALSLAAGMLAWGVLGLPEAAGLRRRWAGARANLGGSLPAVAAWLAGCLLVVVLLQVVRPDGRLHIHRFTVGRGEAVFIRGPTGRTALVVGGRVDPVQLANQVADRLAVWEHRLDAVLELDPAARPGLGLTLARYAAQWQLDASTDAHVDLGGGAVLDVYPADGQPAAGVSISYGRVWLPLVGRPPSPSQDGSETRSLPAERDVVSDGIDVWTPAAAAQQAQPALRASVR